ncbi:hypothetical protein B0H65DRAFT_460266 [Neurospora tetraspora]|uniref:Uncharacterized protein n=1 Tax=Neurospora tetraspora TaxID=94610 RepID=A0AAE0JGR4_9PEZI|nr:hypothetical protein B0H65DRAFT_460266 [Neurospora tetraspora]
MSFLAEQLRYFEWETSQWALFQPYRQNHLEKGISREELCRAYYRWLIDSLERHDELVRSEPLRINKILQRRLVLNLRDMYPELLSDERNPPPLDTTSQAPTHTPAQPPSSPALAPKGPAAPAPQPPADAPQPPAAAPQPLAAPAARSTPDRGKNQNNVNSLHRAIANPIPESLPEPEIQQPTRPAKRKRAPCALTRELRSLIQLGGPGNALVGRAVVIEPDNADQQEPQENGPNVAG